MATTALAKYRVGQKAGPQTRDHNSVKKITGRFLRKFAVKWILKIPPHLAYVAIHYVVKHWCQQNKPLTTNYKVVYLHIKGVVELLITKLKKHCWVCEWKKKLISEYLAKLQAWAWLSHARCAPGQQTAKKTKKVHKTITLLLVTLPNIHRLQFFSLTQSAINLS